jgi:ubiquinone/menaquinone biosynthesis C-methylase UbiE
MASLVSGSYCIAKDLVGLETLTTANNPYNARSIRQLLLREGNKVLTIGFGAALLKSEIAKVVGMQELVMALDISAEQLAIARERTHMVKTTNPTSRQPDVLKIDAIQQQFDRIHCRFVLSHMPWNEAEIAISKMLAKLRPCGKLVLEECHSLAEQTDKKILHFLTSAPFNFKVNYTTYQPLLIPSLSNEGLPTKCIEVAQISLTKYD